MRLRQQFIAEVVLTGKTIGYIENTFLSPATEQYADNALLIPNFAHPIEVINNAEQHQRMNNHFIYDHIFRRHFRISSMTRFSRKSMQHLEWNWKLYAHEI